MATNQFELNEQNRIKEFHIDPENPHIKITRLGSSHSSENKREFARILIIKIVHGKPPMENVIIMTPDTLSQNNMAQILSELNEPNLVSVQLEIDEASTFKSLALRFEIELGRKNINVFSPLKEFEKFLNNRVNSKILFSAPFGSGKSFFLDYFFNQQNKYEFNVFTLYPVNYSVASNEDIFKYVKADILFQLLASDVEFDKEEIDINQTFQEYAYLNPKKTIFSFLKNVSKLNSTTELLSKAVDALNEFLKPISEYHESQQKDDKQKAKDWLKGIHEQEGSLFEDNFYTQLIRQLLEHLKGKNAKPNILIIEDLDRMDPDHIFRILNVISAHYDTYQFSNEEFPNKFGFDKIILVGDVQNIQNIFHHKYGKETDFRGYINKFFSSRPFLYDNKKQIDEFIKETFQSLTRNGNQNPHNTALIQLLNLLHQYNCVSLRNIIKINQLDFTSFSFDAGHPRTLLSKSPFTTPLAYLMKIEGKYNLMNLIDQVIEQIHFSSNRFEKEAKILLASLGLYQAEKNLSIYGGLNYMFNYTEHVDYDCFTQITDIKCYNNSGQVKEIDLEFNNLDFLKLLKENLKRIIDLEREYN